MIKILHNPSQIVTVNTNGKNYKRGDESGIIEVLTGHSIIIENDKIKDVIPNSSLVKNSSNEYVDIKDKVILPGLIECHTHTAFTGSRSDEFRKRISGISYEEIAKYGGGINTTVEAVRNSSFEDLIEIIKPRINYFIEQGVTTLEIKSGYGLDFQNEIKLLTVINHLNKIYPIDIVPTFLGAHTYPNNYTSDHEAYIKEIIDEMLPFISENKLAEFCDGFCEATAFSAEEISLIFDSALRHGFKIKLHTEQFNNIGGLQSALKHKAVSVDHLEVLKEDDIPKLAESETVSVLLPGVSFFLNYEYAPAEKLIKNNAIVALATDFNPGSSNISNISLIMGLASINMRMKIEEVISAYTINAAKALCKSEDRGSIEIGKKADFAVFETKDYSDIAYQVGRNLNCITIKNGEVIFNEDNRMRT